MKKLSLFALGMLAWVMCGAQTFPSVTDGVFRYLITSEEERTVAVADKFGNLGRNSYTGRMVVPDSIDVGGVYYRVTAVSEGAFRSCDNLELILPNTVREIGRAAFYRTHLLSLTLDDSLEALGEGALLDVTGLRSLRIPRNLRRLGPELFRMPDLDTLTVDPANPYFVAMDNCLYSFDTTLLVYVPEKRAGVFVVPASVRHIRREAFSTCAIEEAVLPEGLVSIGHYAFENCARLKRCHIPSTVRHIVSSPFPGCDSLSQLTLDSANTYYVMEGNAIYSARYDTLVSYHITPSMPLLHSGVRVVGGMAGTQVQVVTLPEGVVGISDYAFASSTLRAIYLPSTLRYVGEAAFMFCNNLTKMELPEGVEWIGPSAFYNSSGLRTVVLPPKLEVIPDYAFGACPNLGTVVWNRVVRHIGYQAFAVTQLRHVTLPASMRVLEAWGLSADPLETLVFTGPMDTIGTYSIGFIAVKNITFWDNPVPPVTYASAIHSAAWDRVQAIYVPCGATAAYEADPFWGHFAGRYRELCDTTFQDTTSVDTTGVDTTGGGGFLGVRPVQGARPYVTGEAQSIVVHGAAGLPVAIYDAMGRRLYAETPHTDRRRYPVAAPGLYVARVGGASHKVVVSR